MSYNNNTTLDPVEGGRGGGGVGSALIPVLTILFHSDLRRIGDSTSFGVFFPNKPLLIGRQTPLFCSSTDDSERPLADPCISRAQAEINWTSRLTFTITAKGAREMELFRIDGTTHSVGDPVEAGTVIAIGDRVLLLLTLRRRHQGFDRMELDGDSEVIWSLRDRIRGVAASDSTVLVQGESGVGKEVVARSIHRCSPRRAYPQLVVNCAAIPENLLESELFGHVRGAFTGADRDKTGYFRAAGRGTLFLDEIGDLPLSMQGKLLRVLQEKKMCAVGGVSEEAIAARVIAATNRDLRSEVKAGRFREDLFYRLTTLTVDVPPLRTRREDIPVLFRRFLHECTDLHPELARLWRDPSPSSPMVPLSLFRSMLAYSWPGNVRHLRNVAEKIAVANLDRSMFYLPEEVVADLAGQVSLLAQGSEEPKLAEPMKVPRTENPGARRQTGEIDADLLLALLEEHDYVQRQVAQQLGVSHTTIDRRMRELGLRRPRDLSRNELEEVARQTGHDLDTMARTLKVSRRGLRLRLRSLGIVTD